MRRFTLILGAALFCAPLFAQNGILQVVPGHDGKEMTIEDITLERQRVYPQGIRMRWTKDGDIEKGTAASRPERFFSKEGSLYMRGNDGTPVAIACSEGRGIVYGETVSRNEFGIDGGIFVSPDSSKVAFYRKDESKVTEFPLLDINSRTGDLVSIRYPMNGMTSENITLGIYDIADGSTVYADVTDFDDERYLSNISWSPDCRYIFIQVGDRSQHHVRLNMYRAADGAFVRTILTEDNDAWVEPQDPLHFLKGRYEFIYRTDNRDAYRNLYLCDTLGHVRRLTAVNADVEYKGNDGEWVYYSSAEVSPAENHLYRMKLTFPKKGGLDKIKFGKCERLTSERGWHNASLNRECTRFVDSWSNVQTPLEINLKEADGKPIRNIHSAADPLASYATGDVILGTVPSADGRFTNHYRLIKPVGFDPSKKYPVIVYVYGGPHSQMVSDKWLAGIRMWEMLMAQKGYVMYIQDNRGTQNHGAEYEKAINRQCGQAEMADQMVGLEMLRSLPWVDSGRIGVHGWSYGGFMTLTLLTAHPDIFKTAVACGPVIDWKWYEIMYGERYMDTPQTNPEGFGKTSLMGKAGNLKGNKLLICQGAVDKTVVWEHSLSFIQECIEKHVRVDYFPYPCDEHNMRGDAMYHLYDKITEYFTTNL